MKVTKIRMKPGYGSSDSLLEIEQLYLSGSLEGYFSKEEAYYLVRANPGSIYVDRSPYPFLLPAVSICGEKYVRSSPDGARSDDLLGLPRE